MRLRRILLAAIASLSGLTLLVAYGWRGSASRTELPADAVRVERPARIVPDYNDCWLPPNIAPANFVVDEPGQEFQVHVHAEASRGFVVAGDGSLVQLPLEPWRELLDRNRGGKLLMDVYVRDAYAQWQKFDSIVVWIAREEIDAYVAYRLLQPIQVLSSNMGTYQRELSTYRETPILESKEGSSNRCVNCHSFVSNDPDTMLIHLRGAEGVAMLVARDGKVSKIDTRSSFSSSPGSYSAWHPNGRLVAIAFSSMVQFFHTAGNRRDVFVYDSDLGLYDVESNRVISSPDLSNPDRVETFPTWSPDGKYLYFSSTRREWSPRNEQEGPIPAEYRQVRFDLVRIAFDANSETWGPLETILSAEEVGKSLLEPRVSPDGRCVLVTMAEYGAFPVFNGSSDLHLVDLENRTHRRLSINDDRSDSWHAWSSNGRWIVFASKRGSGVFGRLYFSYIDQDGQEHKPFLLPQRDPTFYDTCLNNYNAPEFAIKPVSAQQQEFLRAIYRSEAVSAEYDGPERGEADTSKRVSEMGTPAD